MPDRDDETPQRPHVAERFDEIAREVKRRSTQTTAIADVRALQILAALSLPIDDPRHAQVSLIVRGAIESAIEASHSALTDQLAEALREIDRVKRVRREEIKRRSGER
jgi:S-adenosylmethionine synthetase